MKRIHTHESGAVNGGLVAMSLLGLVAVVLAGLSVWLFLQFNEQKSNVDGKVQLAEVNAKRVQQEEDDKKFAEREKEPNREFVGPDDYGRLTFSYPKTWSVYVDKNGANGGAYEAYLHPITVPPVGQSNQLFALRVVIEDKDFDKVVAEYDSLVKKGDLKSSATSSNGVNGTRLDGQFTKDRRGAVVIYKVRDKTVSIFTDADTFKPDFETLIKTIKFNQ